MSNENKPKIINFDDYPDFTPNLTPKQMFSLGAFGGTYWRPIYSSITKKNYKNVHLEFPKSWWKNIDDKWLISSECDLSINKYGVKSGSTLKMWEEKGWITKDDPYGWVQWYCRFYNGRRLGEEDERQILRWKKITDLNSGRWVKNLMNKIIQANTTYNDINISPVIRQLLLHWGYQLTNEDLIKYKKSLNK